MVRTTIELKKEMAAMFDNVIHASDLTSKYSVVKSTMSTILKDEKAIEAADVVEGVTRAP